FRRARIGRGNKSRLRQSRRALRVEDRGVCDRGRERGAALQQQERRGEIRESGKHRRSAIRFAPRRQGKRTPATRRVALAGQVRKESRNWFPEKLMRLILLCTAALLLPGCATTATTATTAGETAPVAA